MSERKYSIRCPNCNQKLNAPEKLLGKRIKCPKCKEPFSLPTLPEDDRPDQPIENDEADVESVLPWKTFVVAASGLVVVAVLGLVAVVYQSWFFDRLSDEVALGLSIVVIVEGAALYGLIYNYKLWRIIRNTPTTSINQLRSGFARIKGRIVSFRKPLKSPMLQKTCVHFNFSVTKRVERDTHVYGQETRREYVDHCVMNDKQQVLWGVEDGTGRAIVNTEGSQQTISKSIAQGSFRHAPQNLERAIQLYGDRCGEKLTKHIDVVAFFDDGL